MYVKVIENQVIETLRYLPAHYMFADGSKTGNFDSMPSVVHRQEGFYPLEGNIPEYDETYQFVTENGYTVLEDKVIKNWQVETRSVESMKAAKHQAITMLRDEKIAAGFIFNTMLFESDDTSLHNITAMAASVALGEEIPEEFSWRAADNSDVPMNANDIRAFAKAARDHVYQQHLIARQHKANVDALSTSQEVAEYDISMGW